MLVAEEELAIQIAQVNRIKIDDVNFAKAGKQEVLEQLAADTTSAHEQHSRLQRSIDNVSTQIANRIAQSIRSDSDKPRKHVPL